MAASEGLSLDELELELYGDRAADPADHDYALVSAAREEVDFLDEDEAIEFFMQEQEMLSLLQNP